MYKYYHHNLQAGRGDHNCDSSSTNTRTWPWPQWSITPLPLFVGWEKATSPLSGSNRQPYTVY